MNRCHMCKKELPLDFFYKDKSKKYGRTNKCKKCYLIFNRNNRLRNPETFKRKDSKYYLTHKKEIVSKRMEWYYKNRDKVLAHEKVKSALLKGVLTKMPCEVCNDIKSVAHHDDYTKPLEVRWLCSRHHMIHHHGK